MLVPMGKVCLFVVVVVLSYQLGIVTHDIQRPTTECTTTLSSSAPTNATAAAATDDTATTTDNKEVSVAPVPTPSPTATATATPAPTPPTMGIVTVDVRGDGSIGSRVVPQVERLLEVTDLPIEVWVSQPSLEKAQRRLASAFNNNTRVHLRTMIHYWTFENKTIDMHDKHGVGGHVGKAYALRESQFEIAILLDGDVWPCDVTPENGKIHFVEDVRKHLLREEYPVDVLWTLAPKPYGGTDGHNDTYVDARIDDYVDSYQQFTERNTGTIVAVNRNTPGVHNWLTSVLNIYIQQQWKHHIKANSGYADQPAFREAYFVHRQELKEEILNKQKACRDVPEERPVSCTCACACTTCSLVHKKEEFDKCKWVYAQAKQGLWPPPKSSDDNTDKQLRRRRRLTLAGN